LGGIRYAVLGIAARNSPEFPGIPRNSPEFVLGTKHPVGPVNGTLTTEITFRVRDFDYAVVGAADVYDTRSEIA